MSEVGDGLKQRYFSNTMAREFFNLFCGDEIGSGVGRVVFEHLGDPSCVIKFETPENSFQNVLEWDLFQQARGNRLEPWLAPCVRISSCGTILIQKRTKSVPFDFKLPRLVPALLTGDMKRDNWGMYKGRLVCHDYGRNNSVYLAGQYQRVKAEWICSKNGRFIKDFGAVT